MLIAGALSAHTVAPSPPVVAGAKPLPPLQLGADATVVEIDGARVGRSSLALLQRYLQLDGRRLGADAVLAEVIEQRVLAAHAAARYPRTVLFPDLRVAFAPEVGAEDKLVGVLRTVWREEMDTVLTTAAGADLRKIIVAEPRLDAAQLRAVLGDPAQIRLDYALDSTAQAAAARCVVLVYHLPWSGAGHITLADVYARQNVQGRISLHQLDVVFLRAQARARLGALLVLDWARQTAGRAAVAELQRNLLDREYARGLSEHFGVGGDMHDSNSYLDGLRHAVTAAEVSAWYDAHREQFRRVERVRARHIRVADEATALRVAAELHKDGSNFAAVAQRHSIAPDGASGGDVGWVARRGEADWFTELLFAQPLRRNGAPVREPAAADAAAHWEIVRVEEQHGGYFPRDSETVRYLAARAIAEHKAREAFAQLRERLQRAAKIRRVAATGVAS